MQNMITRLKYPRNYLTYIFCFLLLQYIAFLIIVILAELAAGIYLAIQRADVSIYKKLKKIV